MKGIHLEIDLELDTVAPGHEVKGEIRVLQGGPTRQLAAFLEYHEDGKGGCREVVFSTGTGPLHRGDLLAGMRFPFVLAVPADALPGFRCPYGELYWEVHAKCEDRGVNAHAERRFVVQAPSPRPREPQD